MIKIFMEDTTKNPITTIGKYAGFCYNSDIEDNEKNFKRGLDCLLSGHGRVLENVRVSFAIYDYSAKFCRELYTHIGGAPTRLQASTRYIDYAKKGFDFVCPETIKNTNVALEIYNSCMEEIRKSAKALQDLGVPKEDASMLLPLGMVSKMVWNGNLRTLLDMSRQRMCSRAYWEYRQFMNELRKELSKIDKEWDYIATYLFFPKCVLTKYCAEKNGCGRYPKKENNE